MSDSEHEELFFRRRKKLNPPSADALRIFREHWQKHDPSYLFSRPAVQHPINSQSCYGDNHLSQQEESEAPRTHHKSTVYAANSVRKRTIAPLRPDPALTCTSPGSSSSGPSSEDDVRPHKLPLLPRAPSDCSYIDINYRDPLANSQIDLSPRRTRNAKAQQLSESAKAARVANHRVRKIKDRGPKFLLPDSQGYPYDPDYDDELVQFQKGHLRHHSNLIPVSNPDHSNRKQFIITDLLEADAIIEFSPAPPPKSRHRQLSFVPIQPRTHLKSLHNHPKKPSLKMTSQRRKKRTTTTPKRLKNVSQRPPLTTKPERDTQQRPPEIASEKILATATDTFFPPTQSVQPLAFQPKAPAGSTTKDPRLAHASRKSSTNAPRLVCGLQQGRSTFIRRTTTQQVRFADQLNEHQSRASSEATDRVGHKIRDIRPGSILAPAKSQNFQQENERMTGSLDDSVTMMLSNVPEFNPTPRYHRRQSTTRTARTRSRTTTSQMYPITAFTPVQTPQRAPPSERRMISMLDIVGITKDPSPIPFEVPPQRKKRRLLSSQASSIVSEDAGVQESQESLDMPAPGQTRMQSILARQQLPGTYESEESQELQETEAESLQVRIAQLHQNVHAFS